MLIFEYQLLENFLEALKYRIANDVFSQYLEGENSLTNTSNKHRVILQFLGHPDPQNLNIIGLYQIKIEMKTKNERAEITDRLKKAFEAAGNIQLIQGTITELYRSLS